MKLLSEYEMSEWTYSECLKGNDTKEMRKLITNQCDIYLYWLNVKDREEMRKLITNQCDIYLYCLNVKDREEMWTKITDPTYALLYCIDVKNRPEVRKYINNSKAKEYRTLYNLGKTELLSINIGV